MNISQSLPGAYDETINSFSIQLFNETRHKVGIVADFLYAFCVASVKLAEAPVASVGSKNIEIYATLPKKKGRKAAEALREEEYHQQQQQVTREKKIIRTSKYFKRTTTVEFTENRNSLRVCNGKKIKTV